MKTAMQELIERLKRNIKEMPNEKNQFTQGYKAGLSFVIEFATNSLEKEKEQNIEFSMFMYKAVSEKNGVPNNLIQSSERLFKSQFDKKYNG